MKLLPEHVLGARGILRMSQAELAELATVSDRTIQHFEAGKMHLKDETLLRLQMALEHCGIEFFNTGKPGVRYHPDRDRRRLSRTEPVRPVG